MKVCYVAHSAVSLAGAERSLLSLMENVRKYGVEPVLITDNDCPLVEAAKEMGVPTKVIPVKNYTYSRKVVNKRAYLLYPVKRAYNLRFHRRMKRFLREEGVDLLHLNSSVVCHEWANVARQCRIPYVWHLREFMDMDHNAVTLGKRYFLSLIRGAEKRIAISGAVQEYWTKRLGCGCDLVYNGLNKDEYYQEHTILDEDKIRCVIIARVVEGKGQLEAVRAVRLLRDRGIRNIRLTLVGFRHMELSEYERKIEAYIRRHKLEEFVELMDFTSDVRKVHAGNDIGLICSRAEAFGRITIEYMLAGLLALGADTGGTPELIGDGVNGLLYRQGDPASLAGKIEWIQEHREAARKMAALARETAKDKFSIEKTAENVYHLYRQIIPKG